MQDETSPTGTKLISTVQDDSALPPVFARIFTAKVSLAYRGLSGSVIHMPATSSAVCVGFIANVTVDVLL